MTEDVKIKISSEFDKTGFDKLKTSITGVNSSLETVKASSKSVKESFDSMSIGMSALASGAVTAFIVKAVNLGAELQVLRSSFIGTAKDIELFRKATAGTVDDAALIQLSNYASDLGVSLEDQAKLFSLAEDAADKYGGTVESNFERVINASDGSAKGLRSVGIAIKDFNDEMEKLVATTGRQLDSMDAEEQQNIRLQAIYNLTGTTLESVNQKTQDNKDKMDSLKVTVTNLTATFGESLVTALSGTVDKLSSVTSATEKAGLQLFSFNEIVASIGSTIGDLSPLVSVFKLISSEVENATDKVRQFFESAKLSSPTFQFQAGENEMQVDKFGNLIPPKTDIASQTTKKTIKQSGKGGNMDKTAEQKLEKATAYYAPGGGVFIFDTSTANIQTKLIGGLTSESIRQTGFQVESDAIRGIKGKDTGAQVTKTLEDTQTIYSNISSTMNLLGVSTDSFVGKLVGGFGTVLTIMESIKAVNSILSFLPIPGFADGGVMPGVSWVGERGKELMFNPGAYIMNHSDSMRFANQTSGGQSVNVYLSGNIDVTASQRKENKKYRAITIRQ